MGTAVGLAFGLGVLLLWSACTTPRPDPRPRATHSWARDLLAQAGVGGISPAGLYGGCVLLSLCGFVGMLLLTRTPAVAAVFALFAANAPLALLRSRRRRRRASLREVWPEAVDNLASAVRAGLSLPEAVGQLGSRGPAPLRPAFSAFAEDLRATGRFAFALDRLKDTLADPVGDRVVETVRMAREVGGADLGVVLRTLSAFLREDARVRGELESRQSWTVNGARLAVAAPWLVLALLSVNPTSLRAYNTRPGLLVLVCGAAACLVAYRLMLRLGRLPEDARVLR